MPYNENMMLLSIMVLTYYINFPLGISKDWPEYLVNQDPLVHDQMNHQTTRPYIEEHSRDSTHKKIKKKELLEILNKIEQSPP